jgi:hypothetical protein
MRVRKRLDCAEQSAARRPAKNRAPTSEEDLKWYAEPDFPRALAELRAAIESARSAADPPWEPPDDFMPTRPLLERQRFWREIQFYRFPRVHAVRNWLLGMACRVEEGIAPATEAECAMLIEWFKANDRRIYEMARTGYKLVDLGDGQSRAYWDFSSMVDEGPRGLTTGAFIGDLRKLKALHDRDQSAANGQNENNGAA